MEYSIKHILTERLNSSRIREIYNQHPKLPTENRFVQLNISTDYNVN